MYSVQCTVYSVKFAVYSLQFTVYSVKCTVHNSVRKASVTPVFFFKSLNVNTNYIKIEVAFLSFRMSWYVSHPLSLSPDFFTLHFQLLAPVKLLWDLKRHGMFRGKPASRSLISLISGRTFTRTSSSLHAYLQVILTRLTRHSHNAATQKNSQIKEGKI